MGEYVDADSITPEVKAFGHTEHLCMYLALHLRPDEKSPAIETESLAAAVSDKDAVFKSYPQEMLVLVESLLDEETAMKQPPISGGRIPALGQICTDRCPLMFPTM